MAPTMSTLLLGKNGWELQGILVPCGTSSVLDDEELILEDFDAARETDRASNHSASSILPRLQS